jgi:hypothetical protein
METEKTILWLGKSGKEYKYWISPLDVSFKDSPGNYIFAKESSPGYWSPVYIGQTNSLKDRLADHEKESCAKQNGATHIHSHTSSSEENERRAEETDLIIKWVPPCNTLLT